MECNYDIFYDEPLKYIKECYPNINPTTKKVQNPLNRTDSPEECFLLNNKKEKYYFNTYNPQRIIDNINKYEIDEKIKKDYIEKLKKLINLEVKEKCCNCISFTYYTIDVDENTSLTGGGVEPSNPIESSEDKLEKLKKLYENKLINILQYLSSLRLSVLNMSKKLENFLARIYVDISLFKTLTNAKKYKTDESESLIAKNLEIINYLFTADNVEIYTYLCKSYTTNLSQLRSMRFLTMIDDEVSCSIMREADGFVTYMDCYNIQNFVNSNKILFTYNINKHRNFAEPDVINMLDEYIKNPSEENLKQLEQDFYLEPYSTWLKTYQNFDSYYDTHSNLFDLLAGVIGFNLQIKREQFYDTLTNLRRTYDKFNEINEKKITYEFFKEKILFYETLTSQIGGGIGSGDDINTTFKIEFEQHLDELKKTLSSEIIINKPVGLQKLLNINMNLLNIGFDEIFLMILFRDIYTYNIKYEKFAFGRDKFITFENMKSIHFIMNNVFVVKKLITLKLSPIYDDKFELKYNSDTSLNIEFTLADFIKELPTDKKMILSHLILNESNIITKINNIFSSIYKNTTIFNITDADRGNPTFYHNQEILIEKLLLSIFDLCIDNLHFKSNEYGIDIKLTDNLLSTHLNYNIIKHNDLNIADIYFNLYSGIYGQFYNSQILIKNPKYIEHSGGYESKYLKYKSKYLKLKNKLSNNIH
jgi:hypothetical protein